MIKALRNFFFEDFWLKLFSAVSAILIWLTVNFFIHRDVPPSAPLNLMTTDQRTFANVPVVVLSSAEDVRSVRVHPKEVELTVQGDARSLKQLQARDLRVLADLTGIEAAQGLRKRLQVSTPPGITYVGVYPEEVQVIFPQKTTQEP
jgi:YbbR domain-containing protein